MCVLIHDPFLWYGCRCQYNSPGVTRMQVGDLAVVRSIAIPPKDNEIAAAKDKLHLSYACTVGRLQRAEAEPNVLAKTQVERWHRRASGRACTNLGDRVQARVRGARVVQAGRAQGVVDPLDKVPTVIRPKQVSVHKLLALLQHAAREEDRGSGDPLPPARVPDPIDIHGRHGDQSRCENDVASSVSVNMNLTKCKAGGQLGRVQASNLVEHGRVVWAKPSPLRARCIGQRCGAHHAWSGRCLLSWHGSNRGPTGGRSRQTQQKGGAARGHQWRRRCVGSSVVCRRKHGQPGRDKYLQCSVVGSGIGITNPNKTAWLNHTKGWRVT